MPILWHPTSLPTIYICPYFTFATLPWPVLPMLNLAASGPLHRLSIARGALCTTVNLIYVHSLLSLHRGSPRCLSQCLGLGWASLFAPQHFSQFVIAHFIYIIACLLREPLPRAWTRGSDYMSFQRSFPSHQLCGLGQVPSLCAALVSLSVQPASQMTSCGAAVRTIWA